MTDAIAEVREVLPAGSWDEAPEDFVVLTYDDRHRRRRVLSCTSGRQILLNLAEARVLADGDGLPLQGGGTVAVRAAPERLIEVRVADTHALLRVTWHLGNRHLPTEIFSDRLRIRDDHVILDLLHRLGAETTHIEAPFNPEGGAYGHGHVEGHTHGDAHDHAHQHTHDHGSLHE